MAKETEINTMEMLLRSISSAVAAAVGTTAIGQIRTKASVNKFFL